MLSGKNEKRNAKRKPGFGFILNNYLNDFLICFKNTEGTTAWAVIRFEPEGDLTVGGSIPLPSFYGVRTQTGERLDCETNENGFEPRRTHLTKNEIGNRPQKLRANFLPETSFN